MKTISVETLIKTIRDNYDKYIEEGFDVPEVKIEHGNGFMKLETAKFSYCNIDICYLQLSSIYLIF